MTVSSGLKIWGNKKVPSRIPLVWCFFDALNYFDMQSSITGDRCTRPSIAHWLFVNIGRRSNSNINISRYLQGQRAQPNVAQDDDGVWSSQQRFVWPSVHPVYQQVIQYLKKHRLPAKAGSSAAAVMHEVTGPATGTFGDDAKRIQKAEAAQIKQLAHH